MSRTVAVETTRGVKISKTKASHRIDIIAALSFAALAAVTQGRQATKIEWTSGGVRERGADHWARDLSGAGSSDASNRAHANGKRFCEEEDRQSPQAKIRSVGREFWSGY
jgi:hypothetical protein